MKLQSIIVSIVKDKKVVSNSKCNNKVNSQELVDALALYILKIKSKTA